LGKCFCKLSKSLFFGRKWFLKIIIIIYFLFFSTCCKIMIYFLGINDLFLGRKIIIEKKKIIFLIFLNFCKNNYYFLEIKHDIFNKLFLWISNLWIWKYDFLEKIKEVK
jgi:hypothetical protein